eukprot:gene13017-biopygen8156
MNKEAWAWARDSAQILYPRHEEVLQHVQE